MKTTTPHVSNQQPSHGPDLLQCCHLGKTFGQHIILQDITFTVPHGKIVGLLGQNGAGKSTIIKLINDLLIPTTGTVLFQGHTPDIDSKRRIAYLPERTYLDKTMYVREAVKFFSEFYDNFSQTKATALIQDLKLNPNQKISQMSKGMQEKLQLILVMSRDADLYILDEPLGGVDPATRDYILDTILTNFRPGASVLISTHLIADIERILDEVIFLNDGKITLQDNADHLRETHHASIDEIFRQTFRNQTHAF